MWFIRLAIGTDLPLDHYHVVYGVPNSNLQCDWVVRTSKYPYLAGPSMGNSNNRGKALPDLNQATLHGKIKNRS